MMEDGANPFETNFFSHICYSNISASVVFQSDGKQCDGAGCFVAEHWELQRPDRGKQDLDLHHETPSGHDLPT